MANVSYLHFDQNDDVYPQDLEDFNLPSQHLLSRPQRHRSDPYPTRFNQVNHDLIQSDIRIFERIHHNNINNDNITSGDDYDMNLIEFDMGFGLCNYYDNDGDCEICPQNVELNLTDSDYNIENGEDYDFGMNEVCEDIDEGNLMLSWSTFRIDDNDNDNNRVGGDVDVDIRQQYLEWEQVDGGIDERGELLDVFIAPEDENRDRVTRGEDLGWEVFLDFNDIEGVAGVLEERFEGDDDEENEMLFRQFVENGDLGLVRPPASKRVVEKLLNVVMTSEDNDAVCAVCKDEIGVGEVVKRLPCSHFYHGDCIVPWLCIQNTCPVCRYELPTDDLGYERRKVERVVSGI
uniref:E3 ubiquitin-protein ligase CIP8-like n=1 Tax=Erigeron canadensis TaxID=72917 RepID=UPI001CB96265|nr:E3 ubiquitin-protein ligase CIP8-like [Erigeron canadensis]